MGLREHFGPGGQRRERARSITQVPELPKGPLAINDYRLQVALMPVWYQFYYLPRHGSKNLSTASYEERDGMAGAWTEHAAETFGDFRDTEKLSSAKTRMFETDEASLRALLMEVFGPPPASIH